jgi:hypothetical protein
VPVVLGAHRGRPACGRFSERALATVLNRSFSLFRCAAPVPAQRWAGGTASAGGQRRERPALAWLADQRSPEAVERRGHSIGTTENSFGGSPRRSASQPPTLFDPVEQSQVALQHVADQTAERQRGGHAVHRRHPPDSPGRALTCSPASRRSARKRSATPGWWAATCASCAWSRLRPRKRGR